MALTSGFFNSLNHDRQYNAEDFSRFFDGTITDGVFENFGEKFVVIATGQGMNVAVGTGRAWFNGTWTYNDARAVMTIDAAESVLNRIDCVALEINHTQSVRENRFVVVKGAPASNPVRPTLVDEGDVHQHALAYITVNHGVTEIINANIQNVIGLSETPFVTSILQQTDVDYLYNTWDAAYQDWFSGTTAGWTTWFNGVQTTWSTWYTQADADYATWKAAKEADYSGWKAEIEEEVDDIISEAEATIILNRLDEVEDTADHAETIAEAAASSVSQYDNRITALETDRDIQYLFTLPASGWSNGSQSVTIQGITANSIGVFGYPNNLTDAQFEAISAAAIRVTAQAANSITVKAAGTEPTIDIPCAIVVSKK